MAAQLSTVSGNGTRQLMEVVKLMTGFSARRIATACAVSAVSALACLSGAASASAATKIKGAGSTLQEFAQQKVFIPHFEAANPGDEVEYIGTGSGKGLEVWGNNGHAAEYNVYQYVGTDQPPNPTQKAAIETDAKSTVLSIPTLQAAEAIIIHLPTGCTTAKSKVKKMTARLALKPKTLEEIYAHKITKWTELEKEGDSFTPAGCATGATITRVVRKDGSGTTAIFKKFLNQINPTQKFLIKAGDEKTWNEMAEQNKNLEWPAEEENLVRGEGNPGVVAAVEAEPGSIGYANLADAYAGGFGGTGGIESWAELEKKGGKKPTYAEPEKPGKKKKVGKKKVTGEGTSNCADTIYVNGVGAKFPPKTTEEAWNEVSSTPEEPNYPLCGFTYDLSLTKFSAIEEAKRPTKEQVEEVEKYFKYMVNEGPNLLVEGTDYLPLPESAEAEKNVFKIAKAGTEKIGW